MVIQKNCFGSKKKEDTTMKKNISNIKTLAALLMAGAAFTACSNDDNIDNEQPVNPAQQTYTMTVNATKGGSATTRALSFSGTTLNATWATTENVYVKKESTWATGSLQPQADGASATLKGELSDVSIAAGDALTLQFPKSGDISYSGQVGTLADIAANFDYATADVTVASVSGGNITVSGTTNFDNQQAIIKFTLKKSDGTALPSNPTAFSITDGTNTVFLTSIPAATYTTNGNGVIYVAFPATGSAKTIILTATVGSDTYNYTKSGVTFTNGKYYAISVNMQKVVAEAVDLGLPSGRLWANMNVGASKPEDYGDYFAWGETEPQSSNSYSWSSYKLCNGTYNTLKKYCNNSNIGYNGFTDGKTVLDLEDDAAHINWGGDWRMPTLAEFEELIDHTTKEWTSQNGVYGYKFKGNDNSIFLPAGGFRFKDELYSFGSFGRYWSSTLYSNCNYAFWLSFGNGNASTNNYDRSDGHTVRPVR